MLELPESRTVARQIDENMRGKTISEVIVEQTPHRFAFYSDNKSQYESLLAGQTICGAQSHGGIVEIDTEDYMLFMSDGACPRFVQSIDKPPQKHQLLIMFDDRESGISASVQMYGMIALYQRDKCTHEYYRKAADTLDVLSEEFTYDYFRSLYSDSGKKMSVKAFLATDQRIPGIGNGVLQDILFNAKIDPRYNMNKMQDDDFARIYESIKSTLIKMTLEGGRNTEKDFFGGKGGYHCILSKDTLDTPCPVCGTPIKKTNYMGGTIYFCENCQKQ